MVSLKTLPAADSAKRFTRFRSVPIVSEFEPMVDRPKMPVPAEDCTTAVCADVADPDPPPFDAVTTTRNVEPTSAAANTYVDEVAEAMSAQPAPEPSQRRH